ncbi:hypothetical protein Taro_015695 [Colocasia esculenta]|uniref:Uncharacterized protein n=1 Tax=Colocasia esculenta TaxID=4460 RepID=A0A843UIJ4_COLES|nr:hypothetical protein [Colocasia esculenta]
MRKKNFSVRGKDGYGVRGTDGYGVREKDGFVHERTGVSANGRVERYKMKLGIYGGYDMRCAAQRLTPTEWWIQVNYQQVGTNPLTYVAVRVLSQTTSSNPCERN